MERKVGKNIEKAWRRVFDEAGNSQRERREQNKEHDGHAQSREVTAFEYGMGDLKRRWVLERNILLNENDAPKLNCQQAEVEGKRPSWATSSRFGQRGWRHDRNTNDPLL